MLNESTAPTTYEEIMGISEIHAASAYTNSLTTPATVEKLAIQSLSARLQAFRTWLTDEANVTLHPSICLVNGEATDGTKNAPVLILEKSAKSSANAKSNSSSMVAIGSNGGKSASLATTTWSNKSAIDSVYGCKTNGNDIIASSHTASNVKKTSSSIFEGRVGMIDHDITAVLYDRTMGCQVRAVREMKPNDTVMVLPKTSMITPDLVASSDAGKALFACCSFSQSSGTENSSVWDKLENTTICETRQLNKIVRNSGAQTLLKILQERKRAETAYKQRLTLIEQQQPTNDTPETTFPPITNAEHGTISTRAPYILFLIHQRFSNTVHVPVSSSNYVDTMDMAPSSNGDDRAAGERGCPKSIQVPMGSPTTFAPYARTLPSSVSVPLCWKRNELAMLSVCIPGLPLLLDVGASTIHLVSEFIALLNAGILERFPNTFPPGLITWDRYVWAASVFSSRNLPATSYYNMGDTTGSTFQPKNPIEYQSPQEIWDELGVLIPLLDMFNHEVEDHQITWEQTRMSMNAIDNGAPASDGIDDDNVNNAVSHPRAIIHKKVKKGSEIYCCYGSSLSNTILILQYGFAQINNISDEVRLGWAISDAVGNVSPPFDCILPYSSDASHVYESNDERAINDWWTPARLSLLQVEACCSDSTLLSNLKLKKKMTVNAYANGQFDPILLAAIIVATMPVKDLEESNATYSNVDEPKQTILISKLHQQIIRRYLQFSFTRKLEKLLQNLNSGLGDFFSNLKLWTKCTDGGLQYQQKVDDNGNGNYVGWQTFFDTHAYKAAMEVESRYYAMGTESCVLTLYDGQLRALQVSLDVVTDSEKFESIVLKQLEDLGYEICHGGDENEILESIDVLPDGDVSKVNGDTPTGETNNGAEKKSPRNRKRNRRRNNKNTHINNTVNTTDRAPALKLHIGNLSYTTTPANLYEYFTSLYGKDNVLECHIPVERDTGRTRGFGFVAMPEGVAESALNSGRRFEIDGRVLKVARSSSAGAVSTTKLSDDPAPVINERCQNCGYRPKYCICPQPNIGGTQRSQMPSARVSASSSRNDPLINRHFGPNSYHRDDDYRHREYRDEGRRHDYDRDREYRHDGDDRRHGYDRDADYYREYRRRDRNVSPPRHHDRDHSPHGSRSRSSSRRWEQDEWERSSRRHDNDDKSDNEDRGRKRSRSEDKNSRRKKDKRRHRSRSSTSSRSPP
jgi:RNA recognition motif-containing protein